MNVDDERPTVRAPAKHDRSALDFAVAVGFGDLHVNSVIDRMTRNIGLDLACTPSRFVHVTKEESGEGRSSEWGGSAVGAQATADGAAEPGPHYAYDAVHPSFSTEHRLPSAPASELNTGDVVNGRTVRDLEQLA